MGARPAVRSPVSVAGSKGPEDQSGLEGLHRRPPSPKCRRSAHSAFENGTPWIPIPAVVKVCQGVKAASSFVHALAGAPVALSPWRWPRGSEDFEAAS